jgi:hypothetical protein
MSDGIDPRQRAAAARRTRRQRIHAVRLRVATIAVTLFIAAWAGIFVQLVSGRDPALAKDPAPIATQSGTRQPTASDSSAEDTGNGTSATGTPATDADTSTATPAPAAVTTAQS